MMIFPQALLPASLLAISLLPLLNAQYLLRAHPPLPTAPPLFIRQAEICASTATLCNDGSGDCCPIGAACTFARGIPACAQGCGVGAPRCTGVLNGLCCNIGEACDYVSTVCVKNNPGFTVAVPTFTPLVVPTPIIVSIPTFVTPIVVPTPIIVSTPTVVTPIVASTPTVVTPIVVSTPTVVTPIVVPTSDAISTSITSSGEEITSEVASSTEAGSTETSSTGPEETTSTPTIESTSTEATPTQPIAGNGQHKLGLDLKVLLAGCGLAFLWGY